MQDLIGAPGDGGGLLLTNFAGMPWLAEDVLRARRADVIKLEITGDFDGANAVDYTVNQAVGLPAMTGTGGREASETTCTPDGRFCNRCSTNAATVSAWTTAL